LLQGAVSEPLSVQPAPGGGHHCAFWNLQQLPGWFQQPLCPALAGVRDRGDRDDAVPGAAERSTQHRAHPAGADHADRKPGRAICREMNGHVSVPVLVRGTGRIKGTT